jgi:hypothetical protein
LLTGEGTYEINVLFAGKELTGYQAFIWFKKRLNLNLLTHSIF